MHDDMAGSNITEISAVHDLYRMKSNTISYPFVSWTLFFSKSEYVIYKLKEMGKIGDKDILQICQQFSKLDPDNSGKITLPHILHNRLWQREIAAEVAIHLLFNLTEKWEAWAEHFRGNRGEKFRERNTYLV